MPPPNPNQPPPLPMPGGQPPPLPTVQPPPLPVQPLQQAAPVQFTREEIDEAVRKKREKQRDRELDKLAENIVNPPPPPKPPSPRIADSDITEEEYQQFVRQREDKEKGRKRAEMMRSIVEARDYEATADRGPLGRATRFFDARTKDVGTAQGWFSNPDRLVEEGQKKAQQEGMEGVKGSFQAAGGKFIKGLQSTDELRGAGEMMGGAGQLASKIPVIGKPMEAVAKFGEAVIDSVQKLRAWSKQLHEANMRFAEHSASMAVVQARQEARDIALNRAKGDSRAGSAEFLAEQQSKLNQSLSGLENQMAQVQNYLGGMVNWALDKSVGAIAETTAKILEKITFGLLKADDPAEGYAHQWMFDKTTGWDEEMNKPRRFMNR